MSSESEVVRVLTAAKQFLRVKRPPFRTRNDDRSFSVSSKRLEPSAAELLRVSEEVRELMFANPSTFLTLDRAARLFDMLAAANWPQDLFGERYEVCMLLSFVAWRHASALKLERESQEWLRVADSVALEPSVASDSLASFLYLPESAKSARLYSAFLLDSADIFAALAILRRDRTRQPKRCIEVSISIRSWLLRASESNFPHDEREFFLGELAFLTASIHRAVGKRSISVYWQGIARAHFRHIPGNRPLRLKVYALRLLGERDMHRLRSLQPRLINISNQFGEFGMYHEQLCARVALAFVQKARGENDGALSSLLELSNECRFSSEEGILAVCLGNAAEIYGLQDDRQRSVGMFREALAAAFRSRDPLVEGSVWSNVGSQELFCGRAHSAVSALEESLSCYQRGGAGSWIGYIRIMLGEALVSADRVEDGREQILLAVPVIQRENMIPEGIHALKLLAVIAARSSDRRDGLP